MPGCRPIKVAVGASQWRKPNENIRSSIVQRNFSTMSSSDRIMERLGSIQEKMDVSLQSNQELGLKLRFAAERGKLSEVRKLLSGGAPAMKDANGLTALHKAAKNGRSTVVKQLMGSRRFCVNQQDKYGWTPLHWASWNGHESTVSVLIASSQLSSQLTDKSGSNALHCAALNGHSNIIKVLATAKVDINLQRRDGWTPLHLACWNGHVDTVRELLAVHCKVNVRTDSGMGPLHLAAAKEHNEIVKELLDAGVAPDMQDKLGNTALHEAVRWSHLTTVKILKRAGCRVNLKNNEDDMPVDIAHREGLEDIEAELLRYSRLSSGSLNDSCECNELKKMLFSYGSFSKPQDLNDMKPFEDGDRLTVDSLPRSNFSCRGSKSPCREITSRSSFNSIASEDMVQSKASSRSTRKQSSLEGVEEKSWFEKLESARAEVVATYKSRIAEVEKEYQQKVSSLEKQCLQKPGVMRRVYSDCPSQQLLALPPKHLYASSVDLAGRVNII